VPSLSPPLLRSLSYFQVVLAVFPALFGGASVLFSPQFSFPSWP